MHVLVVPSVIMRVTCVSACLCMHCYHNLGVCVCVKAGGVTRDNWDRICLNRARAWEAWAHSSQPRVSWWQRIIHSTPMYHPNAECQPCLTWWVFFFPECQVLHGEGVLKTEPWLYKSNASTPLWRRFARKWESQCSLIITRHGCSLDSKKEKEEKRWNCVTVLISLLRHLQRLQPGEKGQHLVHRSGEKASVWHNISPSFINTWNGREISGFKPRFRQTQKISMQRQLVCSAGSVTAV